MTLPTPSRTLLLGDLHGAARALEQVLERARFDLAADRLISLGDIVDRGPEPDRCFDLLADVRDLTVILGNHDEWALDWMRGRMDVGWLHVGGRPTVMAYHRRAGGEDGSEPEDVAGLRRVVPSSHREILEEAVPFLIETRPDGRRVLYTHGGWNLKRSPEAQRPHDVRMDRYFWNQATAAAADPDFDRHPAREAGFDTVYLGHTPTSWARPTPLLDVWNLDQGAGYGRPLTLLDVDTHEHWQSEPVARLYEGQPR